MRDIYQMQIPSKDQCHRLIREMNMLDHIVDHSIQVWRIAMFMVDHMEHGKTNLNRGLIQAAALLHDITKTRSFKTKENHVETGAQFLSDRGFHEVGAIIKQHVRLNVYSFSKSPTDAEIVNYADKRVLHDKIVSLNERMNYILENYGKDINNRHRIDWLWKKTEKLETKLFERLPFFPDELNDLMEADRLNGGKDSC